MKKNGEETVTPIKSMKVIQRNDFQNFTLDSVLLADFVKINRKTKKILDIGTGCGIIALLLAQQSKAQITGIELQKIMAEIAIFFICKWYRPIFWRYFKRQRDRKSVV